MDKDSKRYKKHINPFSYGTAEQWLKFMEDVNIIIRGNGLDNYCLVHFNLTHSLLKGEALCLTRQQNKKKKPGILMFNVSVQSQNMYSLRTIHFHTRKDAALQIAWWTPLIGSDR